MADAVAFSYQRFVARYPEFAAVPEATLEEYYAEAGIYWRNDGTSPNANGPSQAIYMNMVTAHIAALWSQSQGALVPGAPQDANTPVGRVNSATEGSVTVSTELQMTPGGSLQAWFAQTKYGLAFWAATSVWRTMRYAPGQLQPGGLPPGGNSPFPGFVPWGWPRG